MWCLALVAKSLPMIQAFVIDAEDQPNITKGSRKSDAFQVTRKTVSTNSGGVIAVHLPPWMVYLIAHILISKKVALIHLEAESPHFHVQDKNRIHCHQEPLATIGYIKNQSKQQWQD